MPALPSFLADIAARRRNDPLAPVTVIVPSHVAGIQLRRRLASEHGAFAAVRFETLPRLAELLGAGDLAQKGISPLARPIGDYVAAQVAHLARNDLADMRELPGFARVLRQTFRRLRRGGFTRAEAVPVGLGSGLLGEAVRLFGEFRARTAGFYDDEDLLDAATEAVKTGQAALTSDLGELYVLPPGALSAGGQQLLAALKRSAGAAHYHEVTERTGAAATNFVLAPDPATEAREVVREVIGALDAGIGLHEIGVFHGADPAYRQLLSETFANAGVPISALPGTPLSETRAGRGVLQLAELPVTNYSRNKVIDCLSLAPLREFLPGTQGAVPWLPAPWRRMAREAGVTQGAQRWDSRLTSAAADYQARRDASGDDEERFARYEAERLRAGELQEVVAALVARLEPLRHSQPAADFIRAFRLIVDEYFDPGAPALPAVLGQIDQLGAIDAVHGSFSLESFVAALRANLEAAFERQGRMGDGVLVADYRIAAGLSFKHLVLCGAVEGMFPALPGAEPLVDDRLWQELRKSRPLIEDAALRSERAHEQALRAVAAAGERLTWTAPLQASGAGHDHYPSNLMLQAAMVHDSTLDSASALRRAPRSAWLRRPASPLAAMLIGPSLDRSELRLRASLRQRVEGRRVEDPALLHPFELLAARHGAAFTAFDGNLGELSGEDFIRHQAVSPTSLEDYATCGLRYFLGRVLRLRPPDEPEERETIDPAEKGSIVHETLDEFFKLQAAGGRPALGEAWDENDRDLLLTILDRRLDEARARGRTGLDVYAEHERRRLRADMAAFLEKDSEFRLANGTRPSEFEVPIPEKPIAGLVMRGYVDRIDRTPDGSKAWVIDYKTGRTRPFDAMKKDDPLAGGTKLQLPIYLAATEGVETIPLYWFISSAGEFKQIAFEPTAENLDRYEKTLAAILAGVRHGVFPAVSGDVNEFYKSWDNCTYCDFNRLCSRRRDDELVEKGEDPALRAWLNIAHTARGGGE